jgi:hypothetical protein
VTEQWITRTPKDFSLRDRRHILANDREESLKIHRTIAPLMPRAPDEPV